MKKLSLESRNILEMLLGKQLENYGTDPNVCLLCDHLLYKTRTLRDMCIKTDCVWRSYAKMMEGPCATKPDLYLRQQHTWLRKVPFMNITKSSNMCLYNYPNLNLESSMQIIANVKGQMACFDEVKTAIHPHATTNQAVNNCFTLVKVENIIPNAAQPCTSGLATKDYMYELDIEYEQMEKPFGNRSKQKLFPHSENSPSLVSSVDPLSGISPKVSIKIEPNVEVDSEDLNNSSIDNNIFALNIKEEPPDFNEDLPHLPHIDDDPLIAENIKSEEQRHKVIDSQVGNEVVDKQKTKNSNRKGGRRKVKDVKSLECEICKKIFTSQSNLKKHLLIHSGNKPHECEICKKRFTMKCNLKNHILTHSGSKSHECEICKKKFTDPRYLKSHLLIHSDTKPFVCEICKKGFTQKAHLQIHMNSHNGSKPYKCEICKKGFTQKANLQSHMFSHSDTKPYECGICKKGFPQKSYLQYHMISHSDSKPYECEICQKRFTWKGSLKLHYVTHSGGKS